MENDTIIIRLGTETDKQAILSEYPMTKEVIYSGGYLIAAELENRIIGFLWAFKRTIPAPVEKEEVFINVIDVVPPELRRRGIATRMIEKIKEIAKAEGAYQLRAYCDIHNVSSHRLWVKNRFSVCPVKMPDNTIVGSFVGYIL